LTEGPVNGTRRLVPRYFSVIDIELIGVQSEIQIKGRTANLSLFGCSVLTSKSLPKGTSLEIKMSHGGADVEADGRVIYASPELGMGIVFTNIEGASERILDRWVAELSGIPV
jgi:hypothetical protein